MIVALLSWTLTLACVASCLRAQRRLGLVARACHEVRGPLFAVQLGLHGLGGEPARLAALELELARAGRALEDLAAAPAGARAATVAEAVDLAKLADTYAPAWHALAAGYGAGLHVDTAETATVLADPLRIAQACANLIANAAEHGGGTVCLRVSPGALEVADDGPGLPASLSALTARRRRGPRGHGLTITAAIAQELGGRLISKPSAAGARLVLELPVLDAARSGGGDPVTPRGERRGSVVPRGARSDGGGEPVTRRGERRGPVVPHGARSDGEPVAPHGAEREPVTPRDPARAASR
ncbi:MAG TPA: HAMP domain-containing sensor histidine kinase [Solirubrobacter sp.]|nr:HAMP domain-containing sensor histidine kinase [Solirubrobacter sp.]